VGAQVKKPSAVADLTRIFSSVVGVSCSMTVLDVAISWRAILLVGLLNWNPLILVVESIEKPGNLGTMLRTADAAGVDGVIVCEPTTDPFNPNVVRASLGCLFLVPLAVSSTSQAIQWLADNGIRTFAATPAATLYYWHADFRGPSAIVIGSEQYGLTETWLREAREQIRIPMGGQVDSLNAAMAAGVALFEAVRQRSAGEASNVQPDTRIS